MTICDEYDYLVHLVSSYVLGTQPQEIPEGFSFEKVFEFGKAHEVANLAFGSVKKLENKPNAELFAKWKEYYYISVRRDQRQLNARAEIVSKFMENNIRILEVQGSVIKPLYPSTHLRMMSDIDFIIDFDNLELANKCLDDLGYESYKPNENEINASKNDINIELHTDYFEKEIIDKKQKYYDALHGSFSLAKPNDKYPLIYRVDCTHLYLYSLLHLLKHYRYGGCGIRRFVDFYYMREKNGDQIDLEYVNSVIDGVGLLDSANELMSLVDYWFYGKEYPYDLNKILAKIYTAGNHGNEQQYFENRIAYEKEQGKHYSKFNFILELFFPSKKDLYSSYPFCKKHNYPYVLCLIHRAIFSITKIGNVFKKIKKYLSI